MNPAGSSMSSLAGLLTLAFCYIGTSICIFIVARKEKTGFDLLAFIPILGYIILLRAIGRPENWVFLFLIPGVNFIIWVLVWMGVAEMFKHPRWFGVLTLIPIINVFIMLHIVLA